MAFCGILKRYASARKNENETEMAKIIAFVAMHMTQIFEIHHGISRTVTIEIQHDLNEFVREQLENGVFKLEANTKTPGLSDKDQDLTESTADEERRNNRPQTITERFNEMEEIPLNDEDGVIYRGQDKVNDKVSGPKAILERIYKRLRSSLKICRSGIPRLFSSPKKVQVSIEEPCPAASIVNTRTSAIQKSAHMKTKYTISNRFPLLQKLHKRNRAK